MAIRLSQIARIARTQTAQPTDEIGQSSIEVEGLPDGVETLDEALEYLAENQDTIALEDF